jgi:archaellum component FlaD/FlaE
LVLREDGSGYDCLCQNESNDSDRNLETFRDKKEQENLSFLHITNEYPVSFDKSEDLQTQALKITEEKVALVPYEKKIIKLDELFYLNIPKVDQIAASYHRRISLDAYNEKKALRSQVWAIDKITSEYKSFFSSLTIDAIAMHKLENIDEDYIGDLVSFEGLEFYSQNIGIKIKEDGLYSFIYYTHRRGWRLELYIAQDWIVSDNAFMKLKVKDRNRLSGLFRITNVDYSKNTVYGAPYIMGI